MRKVPPHLILLPLFATLATLPLLLHGTSCGHDLPFHVQSWLEAAQQWRHGVFYPHWAYSPAWQAGEPRFIFYPPFSWMLGALLTFVFPMDWTPVAFTWIALTAAGFSMFHLARHFAPDGAALLAAGVYLANPYMMFNAFERGAYAELVASVWIPLVFLSVLRGHPTLAGIALPLSLAWLTNAPAGVMATYTFALLACVGLVMHWTEARKQRGSTEVWRGTARFTWLLASGGALGLALVSFYLLPAAHERRYVQVAMAIIPNLRYQDNFLFTHTAYVPHNEVTDRVSWIAVVVLLATVASVAAAFFVRRKRDAPRPDARIPKIVVMSLIVLTAIIALLLFPISSPLWEHIPNLAYLQFPWRLLTILCVVLALSLAIWFGRLIGSRAVVWIAATLFVLASSQWASRAYRQHCDPEDKPFFAARAFASSHGVPPTDEYTPMGADNDVLRSDDPAYWLVDDDANTPAPRTVQNPNEIYANYDAPIPFKDTLASRAPEHLRLNLPRPETLVLNLRDFPGWDVTRNSNEQPAHIHRDDGLLAIALPAGPSAVDITWRRTADQKLGDGLSLAALLVLGFTSRRSRKIAIADDH